MRRRLALWSLLVSSVLFSFWTGWLLEHSLVRTQWSRISRPDITRQSVIAVSLIATLLLLCVVINETTFLLRRQKPRRGFVVTRVAWLVGLVASNANASSISTIPTASITAPITATISPIAAVSVLAHIERRRREQMRTRTTPDVLSTEEMEQLHEIRKSAVRVNHPCIGQAPVEINHVHQGLLSAVERQAPEIPKTLTHLSEPQWIVEVKVFGFPMVVSADGAVAEFRKKRSLELITWLSLNRDRSRRSAARTAMWDIDISDSAFATVVSDMRRALRELNTSHDAAQWLPATYSDDLPLSPLVVTDAERLNFAFQQFKESSGKKSEEVRGVLRGIRDVPFAGTSYAWADLDGTTTRLVITAVDICTEVAETAAALGDTELLTLAVTAGLRVLPGCDELLELQNRHLAQSFTRRGRE